MSDPLLNLLIGIVVLALVVFAFWPRVGLIARLTHLVQDSRVRDTENLLKAILKAETEDRTLSIDELAGLTEVGRDRTTSLLQEMAESGLLTLSEGFPQLKSKGREKALHIVRAHRIWERHLADRTGVEEELWHDEAERVEHQLSPSDVRSLSEELGHPTFDPHGDPIPPEGSGLWALNGLPMTALSADDWATIVHLEDEPPAVYAQLVAEGLSPGMEVHVLDRSAEHIHFWADGNEVTLPPIAAANITVRPQQDQLAADLQPSVTLWDIEPGRRARVTNISKGCRGLMRRRLLDLGIVPGTVITVERPAPGGDPVAYRVRGATLALRESQARFIHVEPELEHSYG